MCYGWFSYDDEHGFETHATEEEARKAAAESLDMYRDDAYEGWDEGVTNVCWGRIRQCVVELSRRPAEEGSPTDVWIEYGFGNARKKNHPAPPREGN